VKFFLDDGAAICVRKKCFEKYLNGGTQVANPFLM
jgi:hypothetical protein